MNLRTWTVSSLLFGSGICALVYQVAWMRELGLVFGTTTAASAAVLAIFMGGLGMGGALFGARADRHPKPLLLYARLEMAIAVLVAISPFLIQFARFLYVSAGGSFTLGMGLATLLRLGLAVVILGAPTVLMGGTLPAAAKSVEGYDDPGRRRLAILYGVNTLGAVTGAVICTFVLLEYLGITKTLWVTCFLNSLIASVAWVLGDKWGTQSAAPSSEGHLPASDRDPVEGSVGVDLSPFESTCIMAFAGLSGFVFFLMELVWYRMLGPILGGTTYTFGLILAVALVGIGLGGSVFALIWRTGRATLSALAITTALYAFFLALPVALGDRIAVMATLLQPLSAIGMFGNVLGWSAICFIVVLPAALISGIQFPLLISLLGRGGERIGRQTGNVYAWNTAGAIAGSLAGGFGIITWLNAAGTWRAAVMIAGVLSLAACALAWKVERGTKRWMPAVVILALAFWLPTGTGPTAAWRHSSIGAGRASIGDTRNAIRDWMRTIRRSTIWEWEGIESSLALNAFNGLSHINNGKSDGNARNDAPTFILLGLIGGIIHPNPEYTMVVGLGTGASAGWLGDVPFVKQVDVVELEPGTLEIARRCALANRDVLANPKVNVMQGDGREYLQVARAGYDIVFSQPSNPYRAGVAGLFTREFYQSVKHHLRPGGVLVQWIQGYECDVSTLSTLYATILSEFGTVETWQASPDDLLLLCSDSPVSYDALALADRLTQEPFRSGFHNSLRVEDLDGMFAYYVGGKPLAEYVAGAPEVEINTDDRNVVEYGFARTVGQDYTWTIEDLRTLAHRLDCDRPVGVVDAVDWGRVEELHTQMYIMQGFAPPSQPELTESAGWRLDAEIAYMRGQMAGAVSSWARQDSPPSGTFELLAVADALASLGSDSARTYIESLRKWQPTEADMIQARLLESKGQLPEAATVLARALVSLRSDPWPFTNLILSAMRQAEQLAIRDPSTAQVLYDALKEPFGLYVHNESRMLQAVNVASHIDLSATIEAMRSFEPDVPWREDFLQRRADWYSAASRPAAERAVRDLEDFRSRQPVNILGSSPAPQ